MYELMLFTKKSREWSVRQNKINSTFFIIKKNRWDLENLKNLQVMKKSKVPLLLSKDFKKWKDRRFIFWQIVDWRKRPQKNFINFVDLLSENQVGNFTVYGHHKVAYTLYCIVHLSHKLHLALYCSTTKLENSTALLQLTKKVEKMGGWCSNHIWNALEVAAKHQV